MKDAKTYVDSLFACYEETADLADFKEELTGNLSDKIAALVGKGLSEDAAFEKAAAELGDISALADAISLKRKQEVISEAYMDIRQYLKPWRVAAYLVCGVLLAAGILTAVMAYASAGYYHNENGAAGFFGVLFAFAPLALAGFTWLGLTQETSMLYPLSKKRAVWYAAGALLLAAGAVLVPLVFFSTESPDRLPASLGVLISFALPAVALIAFLALTEKDRRKPWARRAAEQELQVFSDPITAARFGMFSGAIWIGAAAVFIVAGFLAGFAYSWVAFLFAIAVQLFVQGRMTRK
ncbi:MAG: permease prefix domain 1-containing protein [Treponema sp.]|jgi:hypothetical protein|nr:permease prefix domain 1-containing protein [Treponema sp.]